MSGVYRNNRVHVMSKMCDTCIFRLGNPMKLRRGRVAEMVSLCKRNEGSIQCHKTTYGQAEGEAVCRGFFEKHKTSTLQIAERMGMIVFQEQK
jgi:hypothetical protein